MITRGPRRDQEQTAPPHRCARHVLMPHVTRSTAALTDPIGLRVERRDVVSQDPDGVSGLAPSLPDQDPGLLASDAAFEHRQRTLHFWLAAVGESVRLHTCERTACDGVLRAVDAEQAHLIIGDLATPIGTYPNATLRASDLNCAEILGSWRLSSALPKRPTWACHQATPTSSDSESAPVPVSTVGVCEDAEHESSGSQVGSGPAGVTPANAKYFVQRYMLFSRYDEGVLMDEEGWFSVTPEVLAKHIAERCRCDLIVDAFAGVGGNAIQFAHTCERVIAVDLDLPRLRLAQHNATVYEVAERIEWLHGDFLHLAQRLQADVVFLSPPWGGPTYADARRFDLVSMMGGLDGVEILRAALRVAPNVAYFVPKNVDVAQIATLASEVDLPVEVERCKLNGHLKGLMLYFGFVDEES